MPELFDLCYCDAPSRFSDLHLSKDWIGKAMVDLSRGSLKLIKLLLRKFVYMICVYGIPIKSREFFQ